MLAKSILNNTEALVSQALIDMWIVHEQFLTIFKEKNKYEKMKENLGNINERLEEKTSSMRINSVNSKTKKANKCVMDDLHKWWF